MSSASQHILTPHLMGIDARHAPSFAIDRPRDPYGTCLILCFRSPAIIQTAEGIETAKPGDCIVHTPDFPQYHCGVAGAADGYRNDWLHVHPPTLAPIMAAAGLLFDRLIATGQPDIMAPFVLRMQDELATNDSLSEAVIRNQLEALALAIARTHRTARSLGESLTASERRHLPLISQLRRELREHCERCVTVQSLAKRVHLSPERFSVVYQTLFGTTPYSEVMQARLVRAKSLLSSTDLTMKEIATACGWGDPQYFSRLFRRKVGMPPSRYRQSALRG